MTQEDTIVEVYKDLSGKEASRHNIKGSMFNQFPDAGIRQDGGGPLTLRDSSPVPCGTAYCWVYTAAASKNSETVTLWIYQNSGLWYEQSFRSSGYNEDRFFLYTHAVT